MGLDMYLYRRTYIRRIYSVENKKLYNPEEFKSQYDIDINDVRYIETEVGYWRKSNAIHKWFVDNVQNGIDDCDSYNVTLEQLRELLSTVNRVIDSIKLIDGKIHTGTTYSEGTTAETYEDGKIIEDTKLAEELLPTTEGFFFGNTDYNEYYYQDLLDTKKILEKAIKYVEKYGDDIIYHSSW